MPHRYTGTHVPYMGSVITQCLLPATRQRWRFRLYPSQLTLVLDLATPALQYFMYFRLDDVMFSYYRPNGRVSLPQLHVTDCILSQTTADAKTRGVLHTRGSERSLRCSLLVVRSFIVKRSTNVLPPSLSFLLNIYNFSLRDTST